MLRPALFVTALALSSIALPAHARIEGPWCAHRQLGGGFIENNCGMMNYDQCRAYIFSTPGTWCTQNPWYVPPQQKPRRKAKKRG
jgi:hypothetical protein